MRELWKDVKGYEGLYQVSNLGRIKSFHKEDEIIMKCFLSKNGYVRVCLTKFGVGSKKLVHRLVAQAFIPNPNNLPQVNHKDGNKQNNKVDNLEWCTPSENMLHSYKNNLEKPPMLNKYGSSHVRATPVNQYDMSGNFIKRFGSIIEASIELNIHPSCICNCCKNRRKSAGGFIWKHRI